MQRYTFLYFRFMNLVSQFLKHSFLQISGNNPAGLANHLCNVNSEITRATAEIQDRHPFFNVRA
jgi:hypothetical protein